MHKIPQLTKGGARILFNLCNTQKGFIGSSAGKESACNAGDPGSIPGSGRSPGEEISLEAIEHMKEEQRKIAMIEAQAQMMQQRANQFIMEDPDAQASQISEAMARQMPAEEEEPELIEENLDDN